MYVINNATDSQQMLIDFLQSRCFKKFRNIRRGGGGGGGGLGVVAKSSEKCIYIK